MKARSGVQRGRRQAARTAPALLVLASVWLAEARAGEPVSLDMQLSCFGFRHQSAIGESRSYSDYWDKLTFAGGEYSASSLGRFAHQKGSYHIDRAGALVVGDGFLAGLRADFRYLGQQENGHRQMENLYELTLTASDGVTHTARCQVMGRAGTGPAPVAAPAPDVALSGLYYHWEPPLYDPDGLQIPNDQYYWFMADGTVYDGMPAGGLAGSDCHSAAWARHCRSYRLDGNRITFGGKSPRPFARSGDALQIDGQRYERLRSVTAGELPGRYKFSWAAGAGSHQSWWIFHSDGSFSQSAVGSSAVPALFGIDPARGFHELAGRWELDGYTLRLHYGNGETRVHTLAHSYGDAGEITLDGNQCFRVHE